MLIIYRYWFTQFEHLFHHFHLFFWMHISGDSPSPKKWAKLVHQKRFGMWSLTKSLTKLFWLSSNHICRMDIYRKIRSLNVVFIVLVTKFTKIFQLLILDLKMCSFSHHKRWRVSTRKKIIFFQKCYRSSFEGYKKWMHQKIRSFNVFFIVLDFRYKLPKGFQLICGQGTRVSIKLFPLVLNLFW